MSDWRTRQVCRALCQSGKFETGEGGCALLCMSILGNSRGSQHGCEYAERVHGDLALKIIDSVTDGVNVALSQLAEDDHGGTYWAVDPEDGLDWTPTHWVPPLGETDPTPNTEPAGGWQQEQVEALKSIDAKLWELSGRHPKREPQAFCDGLKAIEEIVETALAALTQPSGERPEKKQANELRRIWDVIHDIADRADESEGDRAYFGSTNDPHTLRRQLRYMDKLLNALVQP